MIETNKEDSLRPAPAGVPNGTGFGQACAKGIDKVVESTGLISGFILLVMALATTYEVIARYVFNSPTDWTLDLTVHLLVWLGFLAMAYVENEGRHVKVDLINNWFSERTNGVWKVVTSALFFLFTLIFIYFTTVYAYESWQNNEYGWSMWRILLWPVKISLPLGGLLLGIVLLKNIILDIQALPAGVLKRGDTLADSPLICTMIFLAAIALSIALYTFNGAAGLVALLLVLLFGGLPIFPALGLVGTIGYYIIFGGTVAVATSFAPLSFSSLESFSLACLPLFVVVGTIISASGVSDELFDAASRWVGHWPGGEAVATVAACAIFAAISVSSVATALTIGLVALPALAARKYNKNMSYGLLAAGGTLGIMIPPSGTMIIYSSVTDESLGKLFLAGLLPGLMIAAGLIAYTMYFCVHTGEYERSPKASWKERLVATKKAGWGLLAPLIILGGIYTGIFTPLESGAVAMIYCVIMVLVRRKLTPKELLKSFADSTTSSVMVLCIMVGALLMGEYMTLLQIPNKAVALVQSMNVQPWVVMVILMAMYVVLGMFLEVISCMLITLPVVYPLIIALGFDGIWFAVLVTLNMEMALISPPVGLNLYVIMGLGNTSLANVVKGVIPYFIIMVIAMFIIAFFPALSLWLPGFVVAR